MVLLLQDDIGLSSALIHELLVSEQLAGGDFADGAIAYEGNWEGAEEFVSFDSKAVGVLKSQGSRARLLQ